MCVPNFNLKGEIVFKIQKLSSKIQNGGCTDNNGDLDIINYDTLICFEPKKNWPENILGVQGHPE